MGFLDRIKSFVGSAPAAAPAVPGGPLRLAAGDGVGYYKERFAVVGTRRVEGDGHRVWHYCLRDRSGERAVLLVEDGPETTIWMQRMVGTEVPWDQDVIEGVADEPFKLTAHGTATVEQTGDTGAPNTRTVKYREFEDGSSERTVVLEDYQGQREVRVGEIVHEAELTFVRAADTEGAAVDPWGDPAASQGGRGTPVAAAEALGPDHDADLEVLAPEETSDDRDPTAFDDEEWSDDEEPAEQPLVSLPLVEAVVDSEDDEWLAAARYIRENGIPPESKR